MIPKTIHYCWFGRGEMPKLAKKCIASWKHYCPDYEIFEWNEDTFDIHQNAYLEYLYQNRKYAFLSDYARLQIIHEHGGIYLDTDVEIVKPLDALLENKAYIGFETSSSVNTGMGFGAEKNNPVVAKMLKEYDSLVQAGEGTIGCPILNTQALKKAGMILNGSYQQLENITIYPPEYFNPYDDPTGILNITENTYSIHWYAKTWMDKKTVLRSRLTKPLHRLQKKMNRNRDKKPYDR